MADEPKIEILKKEVDANTGHWSIYVRMVETVGPGDEITGPKTMLGIDAVALMETFNNSFRDFVESHRDMLTRQYQGYRASLTNPDLEVGHRI